jgi:hypothetical protein
MTSPIFTFHLSSYVSAQHLELCNDLARTLVLQLTISALLVFSSNDEGPSAGAVFQLVMYALVGIALYHLLFKRIVRLH